MSSTITLQGSAKNLKFYNLNELDNYIKIDDYNLSSEENLKEIYSIAKEIVEEGEADAIEANIELNILDIDDSRVELNENEESIEDITFKNSSVNNLLKEVQNASVDDIFCLYTLEGEGTWDIEIDKDDVKINELEIDYVDCSVYFDQFDLLREDFLGIICDTVLPETLKTKDNTVCELKDFYLDPTQSYYELYKVILIDDVKVLEKIEGSRRVLAGTDFILDDFEEN